ncbi:MAG: hypothetical protein Q7T11_10025 [Deltaproteobacteria bacterium]|nr:hypothetical protein [Deltaproteobacteria bacterium]
MELINTVIDEAGAGMIVGATEMVLDSPLWGSIQIGRLLHFDQNYFGGAGLAELLLHLGLATGDGHYSLKQVGSRLRDARNKIYAEKKWKWIMIDWRKALEMEFLIDWTDTALHGEEGFIKFTKTFFGGNAIIARQAVFFLSTGGNRLAQLGWIRPGQIFEAEQINFTPEEAARVELFFAEYRRHLHLWTDHFRRYQKLLGGEMELKNCLTEAFVLAAQAVAREPGENPALHIGRYLRQKVRFRKRELMAPVSSGQGWLDWQAGKMLGLGQKNKNRGFFDLAVLDPRNWLTQGSSTMKMAPIIQKRSQQPHSPFSLYRLGQKAGRVPAAFRRFMAR